MTAGCVDKPSLPLLTSSLYQHKWWVWLKKSVLAGLEWTESEVTLVHLKWKNTILLELLGIFSARFSFCSTTVTIWSFSWLSVIFDICSLRQWEASGPSVSLHSPQRLTDLTLKCDSSFACPHRIKQQIQPKTLMMCSTLQLSSTLMNYTCLASHLPRSSLCNVSHAWRILCIYLPMWRYLYPDWDWGNGDSFSLLFIFTPLSTHPLSPISKKKKKKSISLDIS